MAVRIDADDRQRSRFCHRFGTRQLHSVFQHARGQLTAKAVPRQWVQVQRWHALTRQRTRQVVDRAANTGFKATIGATDHVDQSFARRGDLDGQVLFELAYTGYPLLK